MKYPPDIGDVVYVRRDDGNEWLFTTSEIKNHPNASGYLARINGYTNLGECELRPIWWTFETYERKSFESVERVSSVGDMEIPYKYRSLEFFTVLVFQEEVIGE